ncbi:MAG TPA: hypothetical protein VN730_09110 [Steroidobacteraceae bacterium]|nr:hypothetical protein [Steroidobacteraceae bacterium]
MKATSTLGRRSPTLCGIALLGITFGFAAAATPDDSGGLFSRPTALPYQREYPAIPYTQMPVDNAIARLQARIDRGEVKLVYREPRGYLDSILAALGIDPSSQALVYSKTSLQTGEISAATPRAIYFNDDTYVAWVQHGDLELAAMDSKLGQVFYTLSNQPAQTVRFDRKTSDCLGCHDTYELAGGGVPRFLLMSTYVNTQGEPLSHEGQILTFQETPLKYRWGGWYVTGQSGDQVHLGNILVHSAKEMAHLDQVRRGNLATLDALFDTKPYRTDKSDIVALLVLQHQHDVQNLITRVNFEVRTALAKAGRGPIPEKTRVRLEGYMDGLVSVMFLVDATRFTSPISGNSGFTRWFQSRGPRDPMGRSLRDLDLKTRLFKYPLSYLVYSRAFDALPEYAKNYLYARFENILTGRSEADPAAGKLPEGFDPVVLDAYIDQDAKTGVPQLSDGERKAILEILRATKPDFARYLAGHRGA